MVNKFQYNYQNIINETTANIEATQLLTSFLISTVIGHEVGRYGSVNMGAKGGNYKRIRSIYINIRNLQRYELPNDLKKINLLNHRHTLNYLCEQICNLPDYNLYQSGPGGQGDNKVLLNNAINRCRERAFVLSGIIKFHEFQNRGQADIVNFLHALNLN